MKAKILALFNDKRLLRYFVMAVIIVSIELLSFQILFLVGVDYLLATSISFIIAVMLNWIGGRIFVFGKSQYTPIKELALVLVASIFGLAIQMFVVFVSVEVLRFYPLIGKGLSILFSFFWNYFFRARFIYRFAEKN